MEHILLEFARARQADDAYAFQFGAQQYLLRRKGGGFRTLTMEWDDALLEDLDHLRAERYDPAVVQQLGHRLREFLKPADFAESERKIARAVDSDRSVCVTVRSAAAELYALPWELLSIRPRNQHLGELPQVLVRYHWPEARAVADSAAHAEGGRIVLAWSASGGAVPAEDQQRAIRRACHRGFHDFAPTRDVVGDVTMERLQRVLDRPEAQPVRVLQILAHGAMQGDTFGLQWDRDDGTRAFIDAGELRQLLAPHADKLRLVVLSACDSGNAGEFGNHLGSMAQNLHRSGIASVIASRLPLSTRGSVIFTRRFYGELLERPSSLEQAFTTARSALARHCDNLDWASIQLYAHAPTTDGMANGGTMSGADSMSGGGGMNVNYSMDGERIMAQSTAGGASIDTRPITIRPYRGLLPFRREHARLFFGRMGERNEILHDLDALTRAGRSRLLIVAGASGTGKSSVVMAGAIPRILKGDDAPIDKGNDDDESIFNRYSTEDDYDNPSTIDDDAAAEKTATTSSSGDVGGRFDSAPIDDSDDEPKGESEGESDEAADIAHAMRTLEFIEDRLPGDQARTSVDVLRRMLSDAQAVRPMRWEVAVMRISTDPLSALESKLQHRRWRKRRFLLVIDQFEELFTTVTDAKARQLFVRRLWSICREPDSGVSCIITLRVDFLGACGDIAVDDEGLRFDQVAYDEEHRIFVARMAPEQLREAIEKPARLVGLALEPGLANVMLNDVGTEPGALPLLQYTLDLMWSQRKGRLLTVAGYRKLGGVTGALQRKADAIIDGFDDAETVQARRLLVRLVGMDDDAMTLETRRRVELDKLCPTHEQDRAAFERILNTMVSARLLVRTSEGGAPLIEVAHEALIRKWERLRTWLSEDRDMLAEVQEVEQWIEQWQTYGTVLDGARLGYALRVQEKYPHALDRSAADMIEASVAHQNKEQARRSRQRKIMIAGFVLSTVLAIVATYSAYNAGIAHSQALAAKEQAEQERDNAYEKRDLAEKNHREIEADNEEKQRYIDQLQEQLKSQLPPLPTAN